MPVGSDKLAVFTCVTGGYDAVRRPLCAPPGVDFVCFTDDPPSVPAPWTARPVPAELRELSAVKRQRVVKICPHRYLPEYGTTLWVDGNVRVDKDVRAFAARFDLGAFPLYTRPHPSRDCVYEEAAAVLSMRKDSPEVVGPLLERYRAEGFPPHSGLVETCLVLRRRDDRACRAFCDEWASEVMLNSRRDQLSFNYVAWRRGFAYGRMEGMRRVSDGGFFDMARHARG